MGVVFEVGWWRGIPGSLVNMTVSILPSLPSLPSPALTTRMQLDASQQVTNSVQGTFGTHCISGLLVRRLAIHVGVPEMNV